MIREYASFKPARAIYIYICMYIYIYIVCVCTCVRAYISSLCARARVFLCVCLSLSFFFLSFPLLNFFFCACTYFRVSHFLKNTYTRKILKKRGKSCTKSTETTRGARARTDGQKDKKRSNATTTIGKTTRKKGFFFFFF